MILILEDNADRVRGFTAALRSIDPELRVVFWSDAGAMIRDVESYLCEARLISLDHDLDPPETENAADPGDGLQVAKFLAARAPVCPVIVHTSNTERGTWMVGEFDLGGWKCRRVAPIGDDWIEQDWRRAARRLLRRRLRNPNSPADGSE